MMAKISDVFRMLTGNLNDTPDNVILQKIFSENICNERDRNPKPFLSNLLRNSKTIVW